MKGPRVNVVLSTYNGEKYIGEQLNSLFEQDYPDIVIYVRDDGSADSTLSILERYERQGKIYLIKGENSGFCASFFSLLKIVKEGDYWAFCDQDDIWKKDKISRAVRYLEEQKQNDIPLLYYSYSEMIDENGEYIGIQKPPNGSLCFRRMLTGTFGVGFSMVINAPLRKAMLMCDPEQVFSHDWLAGTIALAMGRVIVDQNISAFYRRLDMSVSKVTGRKKLQWLWRMLIGEGDIKRRNIEFSKKFYEYLSKENQALIDMFDKKKYSIKYALRKCFYLKRWRPTMSSEFVMRFLMLIGRV